MSFRVGLAAAGTRYMVALPCFFDQVIIEISDGSSNPPKGTLVSKNHCRTDEAMLSSLLSEFGTGPEFQRDLIRNLLDYVGRLPGTRETTTIWPPCLMVPLIHIRLDSSLKKIVFDGSVGSSTDQCAICLDKFQVGSEVSTTACDHLFHEHCIAPWLKKSQNCPLCRRRVI